MNSLEITKGFSKEVSLLDMSALAEAVILFVRKTFQVELSERAVFVALSGDLGAGKTTFSKEIAVKLGVTETVTSPTFVIQKTYQTTDTEIKQFVHLDAYRLEESKELSNIGFDKTLLQPGSLVFVEWPEKVPEYALKADLKIEFAVISEDKRKVTVL
jgi:tRNA threonylcarbamoyladenosine biosynthesis protein TsaE